jgi:hypothetical protein
MVLDISPCVLLAVLAAQPVAPTESDVPVNEVAGVVVDGAGKPVAGAVIFVDGQHGPGQDLRRWRPWRDGGDVRGRSGPDGKFRIFVRQGRINVMAGLGEDGLHARAVLVDTEQPETLTGLRLSFGDPGLIAGRVLDQEGRPIGGMVVRVFPEPSDAVPAGGASFGLAPTDSEGRFQVSDLRPGSYRLFAEGAGYWCRAASRDGLPVNAGMAGLVVPVRPMTAIRGRVTVPAGGAGRKAPRRFVVETQPAGGWVFETDDGTFEVPIYMPWKRLGVFVRSEGYGQLAFLVDLAPGEQKDLGEIKLGPPRTVRGRVLDARDTPVSGARVMLGYASYAMKSDVTTDARGVFVLPNVADADTPLRIERPGLRRTEAVVRVGERDAVVRLEEAAQLNILVEEADGKPLDGAVVKVMGPRGGQCTSAGGGRCALTSLAPGHHVLLLYASLSGVVVRPAEAQFHVDVGLGDGPATARYRAPRVASSLKVHVASADGGYARATVYAIPGEVGAADLLGEGRRPAVPYYLGAADLVHSFANLPPDRYTVVAATSSPTLACGYTVLDLTEGSDRTVIVKAPSAGTTCVRSP